ncbi:MAG: class I SAM-dependent methyltransferase [Clostridia bacterium]|nr:class I SAM-dependent methyltransferase [Clostridia bacterium]
MEEIKNIYDNEEFFNGYSEIRKSENSHNELIEQPAMRELLPNPDGMCILDLGCGYGQNCFEFVKNGAKRVVGVDLSGKMLDVARKESSHPSIEYYQMDMADIDRIEGQFDLVYSSLAFHYVEDFNGLIKKIYHLLKKDGILLFSQEHPLTTATVDGAGHFNKDEDGKYLSYTLSNYNESGKRVVCWMVEGLVKYHRTFSDIINALAKEGFEIMSLQEPKPGKKALEKVPKLYKELIKPSFLIVKATKK